MNRIYKYLLVLSFAMVAPFCVFSQTHSFSDLVYDANDVILYQLSGDIVSTSGDNTLTITVTDANGTALTSGDVEVYRNTNARHTGRVRITTPLITLDANGQATFTDDDATISTSEPHFYSVKVNNNNCQRAYPGIYLPNAAADVTVETIGSSTITTSVYPSSTDFTAILAVEYATDTDFAALLESAGGLPIYPAGGQPIYYQEVLVDSDNDPSGRTNINGSDFLFWGHEGVTYLKITVPADKVPLGGTSYAWLKSGRNRGNSSTPIPISFGPQVPTLTGTIHEVEDTVYNGSTVLYTVSVDVGSDGTTNTLIFSLKDPSGDDVQSGSIDLYENDEAKLGGRTQIGNDLPISGGYVVYEHTGVEEFTPIYYSIKVNNDKNSSRTYPAVDLPALQGTTVDASVPLTTKVYPLDDGNNTVILQLDITDDAAFQALLSTPLKPAEGSQVHYARVYSDTDPDPAGRVQIPGLIARWGSEGVTYIKTVLDTPPSENYYLWVKDGLNVGASTTPIHVIMDPPEAELPTLTGTIHEVEDTIYDGTTVLNTVSVDIGSDGTTNTLIFNIKDANGDDLQTGNIDLYENDEARLNGRVQIANDLPISLGHVVYEHTGVTEFDPIYYSIKVNNNKNSSRTYPAVDLPVLHSTTVDASIPLTTKIYPIEDGSNEVLIQFDITDDAAFQALLSGNLLSTPIQPAVGDQVHYARVYSDTDPDPAGRVQIPGLIARWGSEGVTYIKTDLPEFDTWYWVKDGLNVGNSNDPMPLELNNPLPIELISFGAKATADEQVEISWSTASEFAHSHFVIEESGDARTFESIGEVKSDGDSYTTKRYSYLDENPKYDLIFYRLKSVDLDGSLQFSNIVSVRLDSSKSKINVYPNPTQSELFIDGIEEGGQIIIFNSIGKVVKNMSTASNKISLRDLPNGIYFIDITTKKSKLTQKIFINK